MKEYLTVNAKKISTLLKAKINFLKYEFPQFLILNITLELADYSNIFLILIQ
jgi:hypothetical protein